MTPKKPRAPEGPRESTRDVALGLGLYRWGDDKITIKKYLPRAAWSVLEPVYLIKKAWVMYGFFELAPGVLATGLIDPDDEGTCLIFLFVREGQENELAAFARELGGEVPTPLTDAELKWTRGEVSLRFYRDVDMGHALQLSRPLEGYVPKRIDLNDKEKYDFES